ncbi:molybdenum cofactor guanylyltransferase MobA [Pollutimonas harenae]|uniref:Molybdenum cofactor guanylyltransferase n=1 Tax=Pollutimonas harenae TaxID=657015 RepID=A0A853H8S0_9BURK|nr:molybdenum cofactor guanylyltransferase MobA [Pollutimonas harenae]NYT86853.1 molybdenum cofactor guanylyltransferase [Pollutimonas harenae]TEA69429.1 molybdenum cofactor guanylyltransferase [Pollutimonas harenae]
MIVPAMLTGLVLAGGQARRMQAGLGTVVDKGLLDVRGEPLVAHAQRFLTPHVQTVLISANRNAQAYAVYGEVIADDAALGDSLGPLAGVERALAMARTPWLMVLPVDVVNVPPDLASKLLAAVDAHVAPIAYACTTERAHPLCMVLHVRLAHSLRHYLMGGDRKVQLWQDQHQAVPVVFQGDGLFLNINTPADLDHASQC